ncbi:MAG: metal-dependent transcriptional regulator, partial [Sphingobacteriales bacterium]|jgi:DtxR family transcriptional regulator, Mn-dependent transcriptional regulator
VLYTSTEENYIKAIYHLQGADDVVTTNALSAELKTRPASVTDMLKKLKAKKLLSYEKYQGFRLSQDGKKVALGIIRRHRLWEYFLSEKLKFNWDEVHEVAEQLEHVTSVKLIDKLDEYLDYPRFDPHGDPIPDRNGKIATHDRICITAIPLNHQMEVCHVGNQTPELLDILKHNKIGIGTILEVKKKFPFDNSIEIKSGNKAALILSEAVAKHIWLKKMNGK